MTGTVTGNMNALAQLGIPSNQMTIGDDGQVSVPRDVFIRAMEASKADAVERARHRARLAAEVRQTEGPSAGLFALVAAFGFWGDEGKVRSRFSEDDDLDVFSMEKFRDQWERGGRGQVFSAMFVLKVHGDALAAQFDLMKAVQTMDAERRAVVAAWTEEPWWA